MDKQLREFLNKLTISNSEIDELIELFPSLEFVDYNNAVQCVKAVVDAGIPIMDISFLIYSNPLFMLNEPEYIREVLSALENVEEALKNDPFII